MQRKTNDWERWPKHIECHCVRVCVCLKEREFLQTGAYACFLPVGVSDYSLKNIDIFLINA